MTEKLFGTGAAAGELDLLRSKLIYLIDQDLVPGPTYSIPGRRLFTAEDLERIRDTLRDNPRLRGERHECRGKCSMPEIDHAASDAEQDVEGREKRSDGS